MPKFRMVLRTVERRTVEVEADDELAAEQKVLDWSNDCVEVGFESYEELDDDIEYLDKTT